MRRILSRLSLFGALVFAAASSETNSSSKAFHPGSFPKRTAHCNAINRELDVVKSIEINYVEINPSATKTIVMVHGWPGLWTNWAHQIFEFQDDYHIIALDQRGFGSSTHPGDVQSSGTMGDLVGDLVCVLEDAGVDRSICLGHDWGAQVCWEAARMRPDIIEAVAAAVVPYISSDGPYTPVSATVSLFNHMAYQMYFQDNTTEAVAELDKDIRRTLRAIYRSAQNPPPDAFLTSTDSFLGAYDGIEIEQIIFMTKEEEDYLVEQISIQRFDKTLEFYTYGDRYGSWAFAHAQGNFTISQPALSILPTQDPVANWSLVAEILGSGKFLPNLTTVTMPGAHWVQLENPVDFNAALRAWLGTLSSSRNERRDEL